jgi:cupin fold WbuC family metalloprotein
LKEPGLKIIDKATLDAMTKTAKTVSRGRTNVNFHDGYGDPVQRLAIAMEPGSYVKPHRHPQLNKWEFFLVLRGELDFYLFDDAGRVSDRIRLSATGAQQGLEIPPATWHCTQAVATGTLFLEVKPGPYQPMSEKDFADWAPDEGDPDVQDFLTWLSTAGVGDRYVTG